MMKYTLSVKDDDDGFYKLYYQKYSCRADIQFYLKTKPIPGCPTLSATNSGSICGVMKDYKDYIYKQLPLNTVISDDYHDQKYINKLYGEDMVDSEGVLKIADLLCDLVNKKKILIRHTKSLYPYNTTDGHDWLYSSNIIKTVRDYTPWHRSRIYFKNYEDYKNVVDLCKLFKIHTLNRKEMTNKQANYLKQHKNVVLCDYLPLNRYRYKMVLTCRKRDTSYSNILQRGADLIDWINMYNDKIKISDNFYLDLKFFQRNGGNTHSNIYRSFTVRIEDEHSLSLFMMQIGSIPYKLTKYITIDEI